MTLPFYLGAAGRPTITYLAEKATYECTDVKPRIFVMAASQPTVRLNGLAPVLEDSISPAMERDAVKLNMLRKIRPPPFKYAWSFYHDKHSASANYEGRLTLMMENIVTIKPFWEVFNQFPLAALKMKDSVHFFKRGVKPVWEDPRNISGGSWTFRVPKDKSEEFWKETLLLAVGEQFADVIQARESNQPTVTCRTLIHPGDDLCGVSMSVRFNSNLITIWNRDGSAQKSIDGILTVMLNGLSANLRPKDGSYYYKRHSEHAGFNDVVAKAKEAQAAQEAQDDQGKIVEAEVKEEEGNQALLKEAEGEEIEGLESK